MQTRLKVQLSVFMFLQYFIWGSWYASLGTYLKFTLKVSGDETGLAYGAFAVGSMISPFFVGLIADRYFASEKMLGVLGITGGALLFLLPMAKDFGPFYGVLTLYCATFAPTLALGNSLSLHHLKDAKRDFPRVKIFSAVGWIAGGVVLSLLGGEKTEVQFYLAGAVSVIFGIFAFTLPHTPPRKVGRDVSVGEILGLDALALLKKPSFAIFIGCMFLICIPLYAYFVNMSVYLPELEWENTTAKMSLAQVSDVVFLFLLPLMLYRFGYKWTIAVGILAWSARYFLLAGSVGLDPPTQAVLIFGAILLHGVCYDFLFIAGQLYVDDEADERMRGAAQGLIAFILWGVGAFVGTLLAGRIMAAHKLAESSSLSGAKVSITSAAGKIEHDWSGIWFIPAVGAAVVLIVFLLFFREPRQVRSADAEPAA